MDSAASALLSSPLSSVSFILPFVCFELPQQILTASLHIRTVCGLRTAVQTTQKEMQPRCGSRLRPRTFALFPWQTLAWSLRHSSGLTCSPLPQAAQRESALQRTGDSARAATRFSASAHAVFPTAAVPEALVRSTLLSNQAKVHLFTKPLHQLTATQRLHLKSLEKLLLHRVPGLQGSALVVEEENTLGCSDRSSSASHAEQGTGTCLSSSFSLKSDLFVVSRVTARHAATSRCSASTTHSLHKSGCACGEEPEPEEVFAGVNHAFHKRVNPDGATLRGILKGCAEQNALGAAAASGCAYVDVSEVFLLAAHVQHPVGSSSKSGPLASDDSAAGNSVAHAAAIFPCPECWRHLCHVARVRHRDGRPPLRLFVYAPSVSTTVQLLQLARQRMSSMEEPMEVCIVVA